MAAGLMEKKAAEAVIRYDAHSSGRSVFCVKHGDGHTAAVFCNIIKVGVFVKFKAFHSTGASIAHIDIVFIFCHSADSHTGLYPLVLCVKAVSIGDDYVLNTVVIIYGYFLYFFIVLISCGNDVFKKVNFFAVICFRRKNEARAFIFYGFKLS